jgi:hypothetical protein
LVQIKIALEDQLSLLKEAFLWSFEELAKLLMRVCDLDLLDDPNVDVVYNPVRREVFLAINEPLPTQFSVAKRLALRMDYESFSSCWQARTFREAYSLHGRRDKSHV